jgi:hypothetical protein
MPYIRSMSHSAELAEIERRLLTARGGVRRVLQDRAAALRAKAGRK